MQMSFRFTKQKTSLVIAIFTAFLLALYVIRQGFPIQIKFRQELVELNGPLQFALMDGDALDEIKAIYEKDPATLNVIDPLLGTVMDKALVNDRDDVIEFILESGWDPNRAVVAQGERPCNPLGYAIRFGKLETVKLLLEHGANPMTATWNGMHARELCLKYLDGAAQQECLMLLEKSE